MLIHVYLFQCLSSPSSNQPFHSSLKPSVQPKGFFAPVGCADHQRGFAHHGSGGAAQSLALSGEKFHAIRQQGGPF